MGRIINYSIDEFWKNRISTKDAGEINEELVGWPKIKKQIPAFVEVPISLSNAYGETDPQKSSIILVSAPGAVGKTTLARQIAAVTKAILIDLAKADAVGAMTLTAGLQYQNFMIPLKIMNRRRDLTDFE